MPTFNAAAPPSHPSMTSSLNSLWECGQHLVGIPRGGVRTKGRGLPNMDAGYYSKMYRKRSEIYRRGFCRFWRSRKKRCIINTRLPRSTSSRFLTLTACSTGPERREMARNITWERQRKLERWEDMAKQTLLEQECGSVGSVRLLSICKALSSILNKEAKHTTVPTLSGPSFSCLLTATL